MNNLRYTFIKSPHSDKIMNRLLTILFLIILGHVNAQMSFHLSPDLYFRTSFNSSSLASLENKNIQDFDNFSIQQDELSFYSPWRLGARLGVKFNPFHTLQIGGHWNGVSSKTELFFRYYQKYIDKHTNESELHGTVTAQGRWFVNYMYWLNRNSKNIQLKAVFSISVDKRAGPPIAGLGVGSFGGEGQIDKKGVFYESSSSGYTTKHTTSLGIGLGLEADFNTKTNYSFTLGVLYSHAPTPLYYNVVKMKIIDMANNTSTSYSFKQNYISSSLLFYISKSFNLKLNRKAHNNT